MKNSGVFLFTLLLAGLLIRNEHVVAQFNNSRESAFKEIVRMKDDTVKIIRLFELGYTLEETDTALCNKVYKEAIVTSKKIGNVLFECKALINIGILNITHGNYETARRYYYDAYLLALKIQNDQYIGKALVNIANAHLSEDKYEEALEYYLKGLKYIEKTNDLMALSLAFGNVSMVFSRQHLFEKEIFYADKALNAALQLKDSNTIGICYSHLALAFFHEKDTVKSYETYFKALNYLRNAPSKMQTANIYNNISSILNDKKDFSHALTYCDSSLQLFLNINSRSDIASSLILKSIITLGQKDFKASESALNSAIKYAEGISSWALWREWNLQKSNLEEALGKYRTALLYYEVAIAYADSINEQDLKNTNLQLEAKFQSSKKQTLINQLEKDKELQSLNLKQKNTFNALLGIGLFAAGIIGLLFYRNSKGKQQLAMQTNEIKDIRIKELEQEKQLVAISSILEGQELERTRMAKDLHDGLGGMLSGIKLNLSSMKGNMIMQEADAQLFTKSIFQLDNAISEMRRVAHNMMPEALMRFGLSEAVQDFCDGINESRLVRIKFTQLGIARVMEKSTEVVLYRIIQELTNNALKHAACQSIFIQLSNHDTGLSITIEDDGKGFDPSQLSTIKGAGLQNVQSRVDYLKGEMNIESEAGKGTSVNVEITGNNLYL